MYLGAVDNFVARVSVRQIDKVKFRLVNEFSFAKRLEDGRNFQETIVDLSKSIAAYLEIYGDAYNYKTFEDELRGHGRAIIAKIF